MIIDQKTYRDKVLGGWLGKSIGGTLGMPLEGELSVNALTYYDPFPDKPLPNDDLDWQVIWLDTLCKKGINITSNDLREAWLTHLENPFPDEYAKCDKNMRRGLLPPVCGWYNNYFKDCMGAPIRSEVWAMICPGHPRLAAAYAFNDAILDHSHEGVYGEVFLAALESAAFGESNVLTLLRMGLSFIPSECKISEIVRHVISAKAQDRPWMEVRSAVVERCNTINPTSAPVNIGFMAIGLLYGQDFGSWICRAVNCGFDTDCTGATVGSIVGIINGAASIPEKWIRPVGLHIEHDKRWMKEFKPFRDLNELTDATIRVGNQVLEEKSPFSSPFSMASVEQEGAEFVRRIRAHSPTKVIQHTSMGDFAFDYHGCPTIGNHEKKKLTCALTPSKQSDGQVELVSVDAAEPTTRCTRMEGDQTSPLNWEVTVVSDMDKHRTVPPNLVRVVKLQLKESGSVLDEINIPLIRKRQWLVSSPLAVRTSDDFDAIGLEAIEKITDFHIVEAEDESVEGLFQGQSGVWVAAKRSLYFPRDMKIKVIAECSDQVTVWHEGREIISEKRRKEIIPAAHRTAPANQIIRVRKGWNEFVLTLLKTGSAYNGYFFIADPDTHMSFLDID